MGVPGVGSAVASAGRHAASGHRSRGRARRLLTLAAGLAARTAVRACALAFILLLLLAFASGRRTAAALGRVPRRAWPLLGMGTAFPLAYLAQDGRVIPHGFWPWLLTGGSMLAASLLGLASVARREEAAARATLDIAQERWRGRGGRLMRGDRERARDDRVSANRALLDQLTERVAVIEGGLVDAYRAAHWPVPEDMTARRLRLVSGDTGPQSRV